MSDYLPEDIIVKILTKLPVKSLLRLKRVSKKWLSIISDPLFAKWHYQGGSASRRLLITPHDVSEVLKSVDLEETMSEDTRTTSFPSQMLGKADYHYFRSLGSCNGLLLCLTPTVKPAPYIWNPTTGMIQKLPPPDCPKNTTILYGGFGYLSTTEDYKVVVSTRANSDVQIFSLRNQVWKMIQSPPGLHFLPRKSTKQGLLLNDALHWVAHKDIILALDLTTDQFHKMTLPKIQILDAYRYSDHSILVSAGCLCYICWNAFSVLSVDMDSIQLWIMSEYGVSDSWTKLYNFRLSNQIEIQGVHSLEPILVTETTCIVVPIKYGTGGSKRLVRLEHEKGKTVVTREIDFVGWPEIVYEESLIWIHECYGAGREKVKIQKTQNQTRRIGKQGNVDA